MGSHFGRSVDRRPRLARPYALRARGGLPNPTSRVVGPYDAYFRACHVVFHKTTDLAWRVEPVQKNDVKTGRSRGRIQKVDR